jgi:L-threonylcarbamoyladenylate synthase
VSVARAAELIRAGRLVAFPTETVYGLGANALDAVAVERIFAAKGRPRTSPLIVHVDSVEMARALASRWPDAADILARRYWPGPLTVVVPKRQPGRADLPGRPEPGGAALLGCLPEGGCVPDIVTAGLPTVALRMPSHPLALELIRAAGVPIAAPSANRFTELSPTAAAHVPEDLADYTLDGGPARVGIESTVVSLVDAPTLLRPGVIPLPEIEALIGPVQAAADPVEGPHASPGMHARHYRPATPLYLLAPGQAPPEGDGAWLRIGREMPADPREYAVALYETLHRLDARKPAWIAVERPPDTPEWAGVLDRLSRAAK